MTSDPLSAGKSIPYINSGKELPVYRISSKSSNSKVSSIFSNRTVPVPIAVRKRVSKFYEFYEDKLSPLLIWSQHFLDQMLFSTNSKKNVSYRYVPHAVSGRKNVPHVNLGREWSLYQVSYKSNDLKQIKFFWIGRTRVAIWEENVVLTLFFWIDRFQVHFPEYLYLSAEHISQVSGLYDQRFGLWSDSSVIQDKILYIYILNLLIKLRFLFADPNEEEKILVSRIRQI